MKCIHCSDNPEGEMKALVGYDNPQPGEGKPLIAFTIRYCEYCGSLCRHDVWDNPGQTWILTDGSQLRVPK